MACNFLYISTQTMRKYVKKKEVNVVMRNMSWFHTQKECWQVASFTFLSVFDHNV